VTAPAPDPALSGVFGIPAVTPAVERAAEAIVREEGVLDWDVLSERLREHPRGQARAALSAALDVEEMARAIDPRAFGDDLGDEHFATRRNVATLAAQRIRTALLGTTP